MIIILLLDLFWVYCSDDAPEFPSFVYNYKYYTTHLFYDKFWLNASVACLVVTYNTLTVIIKLEMHMGTKKNYYKHFSEKISNKTGLWHLLQIQFQA